eukprot:TRINITY_DN7449_c0_g1_i2.p1 TRINITY_DN7449_c0_g1~~TRINITY_DN7449_c0_g1_i2.p1  ORF type:complete len:472 (+),score=153.79 TRINITY_DN7449_c0_g1_i2:155-1570(+)
MLSSSGCSCCARSTLSYRLSLRCCWRRRRAAPTAAQALQAGPTRQKRAQSPQQTRARQGAGSALYPQARSGGQGAAAAAAAQLPRICQLRALKLTAALRTSSQTLRQLQTLAQQCQQQPTQCPLQRPRKATPATLNKANMTALNFKTAAVLTQQLCQRQRHQCGGDALKLPVVPKALGREFRAGSFMDANPRTTGNDARHSRNASYGGHKSSDISPAEQLTAAQQGAQQQQQQRSAVESHSTAQQISARPRSAQIAAWQQQRSTQVAAQQQQQQQQQQRSTQVSAQQQQGQQQQQRRQQQQRSMRPAPRAPQHGRPYVSPIASVRSDSEEKSEEPEGALSINFNTSLNLMGRQERGLLAMMMVPMGTIGVLECTVERSRRSALALRQPKYSVYSQFNRRLIMTAKRSAFSGNVTICVVGCLPAALGTFTLRETARASGPQARSSPAKLRTRPCARWPCMPTSTRTHRGHAA